jgi:hypothetical protein
MKPLLRYRGSPLALRYSRTGFEKAILQIIWTDDRESGSNGISFDDVPLGTF